MAWVDNRTSFQKFRDKYFYVPVYTALYIIYCVYVFIITATLAGVWYVFGKPTTRKIFGKKR